MLYDLALETFAVLLGVSIALFASDWQAEASLREQALAAHRSILDELRANRDEVRHSRDYHAGLLTALQPRLPPGAEPPGLDLFREGFIRPARPFTTAWDAATTTGALTGFDYEEVLTLSRLYARQVEYAATTREAGRLIYAQLLERGTFGVAAGYRNLFSLIGAQYYLEQALVTEYDHVLRADSLRALGRPVPSDSAVTR